VKQLILSAIATMALAACSQSNKHHDARRMHQQKINATYTKQLDELNELKTRVRYLEAENKALTDSRATYEERLDTMREYYGDELKRYMDHDSTARTLGWLETEQFEMLNYIKETLPQGCQKKMQDSYKEYWDLNPVPENIDWVTDF
jgi:predicted RNase H-like nuclease (RuvC/YqgF family)